MAGLVITFTRKKMWLSPSHFKIQGSSGNLKVRRTKPVKYKRRPYAKAAFTFKTRLFPIRTWQHHLIIFSKLTNSNNPKIFMCQFPWYWSWLGNWQSLQFKINLSTVFEQFIETYVTNQNNLFIEFKRRVVLAFTITSIFLIYLCPIYTVNIFDHQL